MIKLRLVILYSLSLLTAVSVLVSLGFWQIDRGRQKELIINSYLNRDSTSPESLIEALKVESSTWKKIYVEGKFVKPNFFLDNSINERQFGYQLITPFVYGNNTILVFRGWVKGSVNRSILPNVKTSYGEKRITGYLNEPPYSGISGMFDKSTIEVFGKDKIRIQKLDRIRLEDILDRKLDTLGLDIERDILECIDGLLQTSEESLSSQPNHIDQGFAMAFHHPSQKI